MLSPCPFPGQFINPPITHALVKITVGLDARWLGCTSTVRCTTGQPGQQFIIYWIVDRTRSSGLRCIFTAGCYRFGYVIVHDCPLGLEPPAVARNRRKATVKIR